jgi:hypothetical protein
MLPREVAMRLRSVPLKVWCKLALAAFLLVVIGEYVVLIESPARRQRILEADRAVARSIDPIVRAAAEARSVAQAEADREVHERLSDAPDQDPESDSRLPGGPFRPVILSELMAAKVIARIEDEAKARGRTMFPTVAGPRASVIEATAIGIAEEWMKVRHPTVKLKGIKAEATHTSAELPFLWDVKFIEPGTGKIYDCEVSFDESGVKQYLATNP